MRLVVFDVDGTIVDSQAGIVAAMSHAFVTAGLDVPDPKAVRGIIGLSLEEAVARLAPEQGPERIRDLAEGYKAAFLAGLDQPQMVDQLFPGALETITRMDEAGWLLGMATGKSRRGVERLLARFGLEQRFVAVRTADDGPGKPHPYMLRAVMADAGCTPEQTVMIGDTTYDMEMAQRAGAQGLGVTWGYHPAHALLETGASALATHFGEVEALAERLLEKPKSQSEPTSP
ncbi:MAG: HAD-IA family hydrolase [Rhodospirillaceae bacterium]